MGKSNKDRDKDRSGGYGYWWEDVDYTIIATAADPIDATPVDVTPEDVFDECSIDHLIDHGEDDLDDDMYWPVGAPV